MEHKYVLANLVTQEVTNAFLRVMMRNIKIKVGTLK